MTAGRRGLDPRWLVVFVIAGLACWALFGHAVLWVLGRA